MKHDFCDTCEGCRPCIFHAVTGERLPDTHPTMLTVNHVWNNQTTYEQRKAFILVTAGNDYDEETLKLAKEVILMMKLAMSETPHVS